MWSSLMSIIAEFSQKTSWTLYIYSFSLFFFFLERLYESLFTSLFYFSLRKNENRILSKMLCIKYTIYDTRYLQLTCLCLHWLWKCFEKYGIMKWIIYLKNGFCQFWWNPSRSSGYKPDINLDQLDSNHIVDWEKNPESLHNRRIDGHHTMYDQKGFICFDLVRHLKRHNVHSVSTVCHVCTVNPNVKRTKMQDSKWFSSNNV